MTEPNGQRRFEVEVWSVARRLVLYVPEIEAATTVIAMADAAAAARSLIADNIRREWYRWLNQRPLTTFCHRNWWLGRATACPWRTDCAEFDVCPMPTLIKADWCRTRWRTAAIVLQWQ